MNLNTLIIILVTCSVFFIINAIFICYCLLTRKPSQQVSPVNNYEMVLGDSSINCILDSISQSIFYSSTVLKDPCCICFDK